CSPFGFQHYDVEGTLGSLLCKSGCILRRRDRRLPEGLLELDVDIMVGAQKKNAQGRRPKRHEGTSEEKRMRRRGRDYYPRGETMSIAKLCSELPNGRSAKRFAGIGEKTIRGTPQLPGQILCHRRLKRKDRRSLTLNHEQGSV